jgi:hypothetical protein
MSFGIPTRNGLPLGLGTVASLASRATAAVVTATDTFWKYVTLLLNTSATNGAQNNTFLDSSTNNFSITRNGDTTQGSFNPYMPSGYWSGFFDGTGDFLSVASNAAFDLGSSDFTVEAWVNPTNFTDGHPIASRYNFSGSASGWVFRFVSATTLRFIRGNDIILDGTVSVVAGTWYHVAAVRSGSTLTTYLNGVQIAQATGISNFTDATTPLQIGRSNTTTDDANGYTSNLRVVKGTAVYTAAFTPPTTPLTAITNTSLLCLQDNRFIDNSTNAFAITRNGDTRISKFAPFNPPASYSTASYGGSGYFDGTGDYLTYAPSTSLAFGTGDFTVECWSYATVAASGGAGMYLVDARTSIVTNAWAFGYRFNGSGSGNLVGWFNGSIVLEGIAAPINQWNHVVYVRSGTTGSLYLNGSRIATQTDSTNYSSTGATTTIAARNSLVDYYFGYMSNFRAVKGTAVYDPTQTTLTVPTAPLTAITNTSLLLNFTNAGIYDAATINDGQTVGNAQVSTTQAKWSPTSMSFDGTGDYLTVIDKPELRFGTAPFTVEFWLYASTPVIVTKALVSKGGSNTGWQIQISGSDEIQFIFGSTAVVSAVLSSNTWTHVAVVREGTGTNQTKIYVGGVNTGVATVSTDFNQTSPLYVGASRLITDLFTGYIQDLRITNGYARYTANFTAPTAAFPTL